MESEKIIDDSNLIPSPSGIPEPSWKGVDVLLMGMGAILLTFGGTGIVLVLSGLSGNNQALLSPSIGLSIALAALEAAAILGSVWLLGLRRRRLPLSTAGLRPASPAWLGLGLLLGAVAIPLSGLIALGIQQLLGLPANNPQLPFLAPEAFSWPGFLGMLILGGIVVPFAEELFFRGVLFHWLRGRLGFWAGAIISSLIFGAFHGEVSIAGAAAVLGLMMAWVYERSRSLWPAVLIHALNNSAKIVVLYAMLASGAILPGG